MERDGPEHPGHAERQRRAEHRAEAAVERVEPGQPQLGAQRGAGELQPAPQQRSEQDGPAQGEQRRVGRRGALREQQRAYPAADERAPHEAGELEHPDDESLAEPVERQQHREGNDDPVDGGHAYWGYSLHMAESAAPPFDRRRRLLRRALPALLVAATAFAAGLAVGASHTPADARVAERFADAWRRGDYAGMWAELTPALQRRLDAATLARAYRAAAATATATRLTIGEPRDGPGDTWLVPVVARTIAFGTVRGTVSLPIVDSGDAPRIAWRRSLTFPGVPAGARLSRTTSLPRRADLLARDATPLAAGADRGSPLGAAAAAVVGQLDDIPEGLAAELRSRGYPADAKVGVSGLERIFESRLAGTPGGTLRAGRRVLASRAPRPAAPLRTTIAPTVQEAAVAALGGRLGGTVALEPATGEILGAAGIAFSGLQPPGSTFKIITTAAALEAGVAKPSSRFAYATAATLSGVELSNANGESCGGTLVQAFAVSCNSVFAPLGVRVGARRLVAAARRFGFDGPAPFAGAASSTIPDPAEIADDLALGSTAIGQGRVEASALGMVTVAATIAVGGRRPVPTLRLPSRTPRPGPRVVTKRTAREIRRMMVAVVREGTGRAAALPGVTVAGKTGTAELRSSSKRCRPDPEAPGGETCSDQAVNDPTDTDAWFVAFAPATRPRVAVGVLLVESGAGGDTAAPAARELLRTALKVTG